MTKEITIGSKVTLRIDQEIKEFEVVGSAEVNIKNGKISYLSPVGEAVLGKMENDKVIIELPSGEIIEGQIIKIF